MKIKFAIAFLLAIVALLVSLTAFSQAYVGQGNVTAGGLAVAIPPPVFVRSGTNGFTASQTSFALTNFNCSGGNYLIVAVGTSATSRTVTSLQANGVNMVQLYTTNFNTAGAGRLSLYGLANPTTGDVAVTFSGSAVATMCGLLFSGVVGSPGVVSVDYLVTGRTGVTNTVASVVGDTVVDLFIHNSSAGTATINANQTRRTAKFVSNAANLNSSTAPGAASSTTMAWQSSSSPIITWMGVALHGQ